MATKALTGTAVDELFAGTWTAPAKVVDPDKGWPRHARRCGERSHFTLAGLPGDRPAPAPAFAHHCAGSAWWLTSAGGGLDDF